MKSFKSLLTLLTIVTVGVTLIVRANADPPAKPACCLKVEALEGFSANSLFQLESAWTNDAARTVTFPSFQGRPQIVTMFFSTCAYACPILVNDMKRIEAALPENVRTNVGFVLISFDTDRDSPAALAAFRLRHHLPMNWTLLGGASDDVLEIAALLGIKFKKDSRGDFAHSNVISLLDHNGEIVLQQIGLNRDPHLISSAVEKTFGAEVQCGEALAPPAEQPNP